MVEKWRRKKERKIVVNKLDRNFVSKVEKFSETKFTNLLLPSSLHPVSISISKSNPNSRNRRSSTEKRKDRSFPPIQEVNKIGRGGKIGRRSTSVVQEEVKKFSWVNVEEGTSFY